MPKIKNIYLYISFIQVKILLMLLFQLYGKILNTFFELPHGFFFFF